MQASRWKMRVLTPLKVFKVLIFLLVVIFISIWYTYSQEGTVIKAPPRPKHSQQNYDKRMLEEDI